MNKRLLCLTMGILMLLTCLLTACGGSTAEGPGDPPVVDNSAKTITMWVLTNKETTPRAQELVNKEFARITKSKFKTNVEIVFCSEEGYWEKDTATGEYKWNDTGYYERLEAAIEANEQEVQMAEEAAYQYRLFRNANKDKGWDERQMTEAFLADARYEKWWSYIELPSDDEEEEETSETEEETVLNEYQIAEIKYPESKENQVDIFYIGDIGNVTGEEKYFEYYNRDWLAGLNESLTGVASKLTKYIAPTLLNGVQIDGSLYGIPNNVTIGEYTYMMLDYDLLNTYKCTVNDTDTVADEKIANFLKDMMDYNESRGLGPDDEGYVVPLNSSLSECLQMLVWYWNMDYVDRTVYETYVAPPKDKNNAVIEGEGDRNYTIMQEYMTEEEVADPLDPEKTIIEYTHSAFYSIVDGMLYKVNENGQYVDKDGNPLNYHYELDTTGGYLISVEKTGDAVPDGETSTKEGDIVWSTRAYNAWYLVDENGNTVTPEEDKRVIVATEDVTFAKDDNGNFILSGEEGSYEYQGHPVEIVEDDLGLKYDSEGRVLPTYIYEWIKDSDFSVVGTVMKDPDIRSRGLINLGFTNLFRDDEYISVYSALMSYEYNGYYGTPDASKNQTAAVNFVKGDASILMESADAAKITINGKEVYKPAGVYVDPETGKWYRVVVAENPVATSTELYGNMFAVYAQSNYLDRSMEVINYLNTNTEMRDLLLYGVKGTHYVYDEILATEEGEENVTYAKRLNTRSEIGLTDEKELAAAVGIYSMDIERTGNCFITTPTKEQGSHIWEYAKVQNNNSLIDPMLGFDFATIMAGDTYAESQLDATLIYQLKATNIAAKEYIDACINMDHLTSVITNRNGALHGLFVETITQGNYSMTKTKTWISKITNEAYNPAAPSAGADPDLFGESPNTVYFNWLKTYGYWYDKDADLKK